MNELKLHFRPEFLNRVDDTIIFSSLSEKDLSTIVDIQISNLDKRLEEQKLTLEVDKSARKFLTKEGYSPQFGARPLKRVIQNHLLDPLALKFLDGECRIGVMVLAKEKSSELDNKSIEQHDIKQ